MSKLEGNPFINWKKIQVTYKDTLYEFKVRAFDCNISSDGVGYHIRFKDEAVSIALVGKKWVRLDQKNDFAAVAGEVISKKVYDVWLKFNDDRVKAQKESKKIDNGNWGSALKGDVK